MSKSIEIVVSADADQDDCLAAAADEYLEEHPELHGYDLAPRWGDDDRETVVLAVPFDWRAKHLAREVCAIVKDDGTGTIRVIVDHALIDDPNATAEDIAEIVREARQDAASEHAEEALREACRKHDISLSKDEDGVQWAWAGIADDDASEATRICEELVSAGVLDGSRSTVDGYYVYRVR